MDFRVLDEADAPDCWTRYHGRRERLATLIVDGRRIVLGLSDTRRCAASADACRETIEELTGRPAPGSAVTALLVHARKVTGFVEKPKRDVQKVRARRHYL